MNLEKFAGLVGSEINLLDLSNELQKLGCEDIAEFGNISEILESGSIVVATNDDGSENIELSFEVIILADTKEEHISASVVSITKIEEF